MSTEAARPRLAVLISGSGTNLQAIMDAIGAGELQSDIICVVSDNPDAYGLERARAAGLATHAVPFRSFGARAEYDGELARVLAELAPDCIALAGYMRIIDDATVNRYRGRMLNIHPSLLPAYPGLHTYARALAAGETQHGATVHFVIPELDAGPGILQYRVKIAATDTEQSLQTKVQAGEHEIYPRALQWLASGRLKLAADKVLLDDVPLNQPVVVEADA